MGGARKRSAPWRSLAVTAAVAGVAFAPTDAGATVVICEPWVPTDSMAYFVPQTVLTAAALTTGIGNAVVLGSADADGWPWLGAVFGGANLIAAGIGTGIAVAGSSNACGGSQDVFGGLYLGTVMSIGAAALIVSILNLARSPEAPLVTLMLPVGEQKSTGLALGWAW